MLNGAVKQVRLAKWPKVCTCKIQTAVRVLSEDSRYNAVTSQLLGDNPRLLDEWQMAPVLWDAVRFEVDKRSERGCLFSQARPFLKTA